MDELKKLFESSVLDDSTKTAIQEAWDARVKTIEEEKDQELAEKLVDARDKMSEIMGDVVQEAVEAEMKDIEEELAEARDLEVKYATKLEDFKEQYAEKAGEKLEEAIQDQVRKEMDELKESIEEARKNLFGKKVFDMFKEQFQTEFASDLSESTDIEAIQARLEESESELNDYRRKEKLDELMENVTGKRRRVIETMLEDVDTDKLESRFERIMESYGEETGAGKSGEEEINEKDENKDTETGKKPNSGQVIIEEEETGDGEGGFTLEDLRRDGLL